MPPCSSSSLPARSSISSPPPSSCRRPKGKRWRKSKNTLKANQNDARSLAMPPFMPMRNIGGHRSIDGSDRGSFVGRGFLTLLAVLLGGGSARAASPAFGKRLENRSLAWVWKVENGHLQPVSLTDKFSGETRPLSGECFQLVLAT